MKNDHKNEELKKIERLFQKYSYIYIYIHIHNKHFLNTLNKKY